MLKRGGCNVAVIYTSIDRAVLKVLLEAGIPVYDSVSHGTYNHSKTLIVSGRLGATDSDMVSQGSANWSYPNLVHNDETVFRIRSKSTTDKYRAMWDTLGVVVNQDYQAAASYRQRMPDRRRLG